MSRAYCIPGIVFLAIAFILSLLVSISLPSLRAIDIVRVDVSVPNVDIDFGSIRLGIWSTCVEGSPVADLNGCTPAQHGYSVFLIGLGTVVKSSWTRGLAVHPVATGVTFIALLLSFSTHLTITLAASLMSFLAAFLTLVAFAIDIAFLLLIRHSIKDNATQVAQSVVSTNTAAGFWMTFVSLILLLLAGCTVCFGRRQNRMSGASGQSYPLYENKGGIFSRFRRN